jgi:spore germination cell wall hydrolase CwlJ-like protein
MIPRSRPKGGPLVPFGLGILAFFVTPSAIGSQELSALVARPPAVSDRPAARGGRAGIAQTATYSLPRPVSAAIPVALSFTLADLDASNADIADTIRERMLGDAVLSSEQIVLPLVDRGLKGDRLVPHANGDPRLAPEPTASGSVTPRTRWPRLVRRPSLPDASLPTAATSPPAMFRLASIDPAASPKTPPRAGDTVAPDIADEADNGVKAASEIADGLAIGLGFTREEADPRVLMARLYFGAEPMSETLEQVQPWQTGDAPNVETLVVAVGPEVRVAAIPSSPIAIERPTAEPAVRPGETVAPKGEVTGEGRHPMTPAARLGLDASNRARQERCLANAIYFESRGESVNGQIGVAQVVLNRAFSGYYPNTVCGVVYQNAHRYLRCQFTFACDRHRDVIHDQVAWARASTIAAGALDGRLWLAEVGKATHYHATYVHPRWVRSMHRLSRIGIHVFYRPRLWGDGADAPAWGDAAATAEAVRTL